MAIISVKVVWTSVILTGLLLSGCGADDNSTVLDLDEPATPGEVRAATAWPDTLPTPYALGFDARHGPEEDARQYLPLIDYLKRATDYPLELRFNKDSEQLISDLGSGRLQFAVIGAGSYLRARQSYPIIPLVRGVNAEGQAGYQAILVVAPNSPIKTIKELKGRRMAFGSPTSTQGHWIPRIMLFKAGLGLSDLGSYIYTGSHRACAEAVLSGRADACGLQDTLARNLAEEGFLRILAFSEVYPSSGIFIHAGTPAAVREKIREALIAFDPKGRDRAGLYHWEHTEMAGGFVNASEEDYQPLATWADRLGLLPLPIEQEPNP